MNKKWKNYTWPTRFVLWEVLSMLCRICYAARVYIPRGVDVIRLSMLVNLWTYMNVHQVLERSLIAKYLNSNSGVNWASYIQYFLINILKKNYQYFCIVITLLWFKMDACAVHLQRLYWWMFLHIFCCIIWPGRVVILSRKVRWEKNVTYINIL